MSATENFVNSAMRSSVASLCQAIGWNSAHSTAIDVLNDVLKKYFLDISKRTHLYAEHCGRTSANFDDAALVLDDMNISIPELEEYVQNFDPVPFPSLLPVFPFEKESNLNFLRPGSQEVLTRPVHVHEYMPPMIIEEESKSMKKDKSDGEWHSWQASNSDSVVTGSDSEGRTSPTPSSTTTSAAASALIPNGKVNGDADTKFYDTLNDYPSTPPASSSAAVSPQSPKTPKSSKRMESPGENPALKRVRMMLEEEGHPLREITSVMMTTSGFLTSSREGKLPESKPPPNRDFFEPAPAPVPKKRIPTMKKIVEGVKKIDKEKENQNDKDAADAPFNLFEKPDKISSILPSTAATGSAADKMTDGGVSRDKGKSDEKGERKEKSSKERKEKVDKGKLLHKKLISSSKDDENRTKKKLIFKKKIGKNKSLESVIKAKAAKVKDKTKAVDVTESGLDPIESDEDFGALDTTSKLTLGNNNDVIVPKKERKKKEKHISPLKIKDKKLKNKSLLTAPSVRKLSKKVSKKIIDRTPNIFETPDKIVPVLIGAQKKKRGRPKKSVSANPFSQLGATPPPPLIKSLKYNRKKMMMMDNSNRDELDMKSFVPEISINVRPPPPPDFGLLRSLPLQPGLIPAYIPPTSLKMSNQLPPSISITPATPTILPQSPGSSGAAPSFSKDSPSASRKEFGSLPSSVCSSVTITRIDMSNSQKLPTPYDSQSTPGIGTPNLQNSSSSSNAATITPIQSDSGITITPIVLDKLQQQQAPSSQPPERVAEKPPLSSGLAKLEQNILTKEQRKKDKEKRKELKKEKKKERKEKLKEKEKGKKVEKLSSEKDKERGDKLITKDKKNKSEKKRKKEKEGTANAVGEATVPKLTLKLQHSSTTTPVDSPNPPQTYHGGEEHHPPPPRKITFKPIEEIKQRTPSPELARFSPLVTRPSKKVAAPKKSPPVSVASLKTPKQEIISFPPTNPVTTLASNTGSKRGRGRPPKGTSNKQTSKSSSQAGLITETVGSYIDEHGNKVWICPACGRQDDGSPMIGCEKCDDWYHFPCVGIVEAPDDTVSWYCKKCNVKEKSYNDHRKKIPRL